MQGADYCRREFSMGHYLLVRVGLSSDFLQELQEELPQKQQKTGWRQRRRQQKNQELCVRKRRDFLEATGTDPYHSSFVCQEPIPFLEGWRFDGFLEAEWTLHLMGYAASLSHFVILGKANCLPEVLDAYARRMKSLVWILLARQYGPGEEELVEELYEQYGLAVSVRLLEAEAAYRRLPMDCRFPVAVLDFSAQDRVSGGDIPKGSLWLDMGASEGKRVCLERRGTQLEYVSLKKEWEQPQKALIKLDTGRKSSYNTVD